MKKIWKVNKKAPKAFLNKFPEYSKLTLQLLWDRGLKTQQTIDEFFNPDYDEDLHDPFLMKGMKKAVTRIQKALKNKEKITIFGDYDADGVCGTAILSEALNILGAKPNIYIPDRNKEGNGLNLNAVKEVAAKKTNLIITVDCGSSDFEEVKLANKLGMNVIIVDHHEVTDKLPTAFCVVNPRQKGEKYPFRELAGSGVAFKLVQALIKIIKSPSTGSGFEKWLLDLVAIATVADIMPLLGENRTLVKYGLIVLSKTRRIGLQELMKVARINSNLNTDALAYILGPRLNAAGRMDHANTAYELLVSKSQKKTEALARRLDNKNQDRQRLTDKILKAVEKRIDKKQKLIFQGDEDWPIGIAGLIAGRLTEKYYRPTIIFQKMRDISKGSARSISGFNIVNAISRCQELLKDFGGHPKAAGFTISNKNLKKIKEKLLQIANKSLTKNKLRPVLNIDLKIEPRSLDFKFYDKVQKLAPFGEKNVNPLFLMKGLTVSSIKLVGKNANHLKLYLTKELEKFQAIGFGLGDFCDNIKQEDKIDVVFELIVNEWNGTRELQLKIIDLQKSQKSSTK